MQADTVTTYPGVTDPRDPLVSPMFGEHTCVTPLHLLAGSREIVGSDAIRVAARESISLRSHADPFGINVARADRRWQWYSGIEVCVPRDDQLRSSKAGSLRYAQFNMLEGIENVS